MKNQPLESSTQFVLVLLCVVILIFSGCSQQTGQTPFSGETPEPLAEAPPPLENQLAQIRSAGVLVVGTAITEPFEFHDPETDLLIGYDVEIAQRIASDLGVELQWVEMPFANLIPALQEHRVDMTIAAMYITAEREALVDFAEPYVDTGLVMVVEPRLVGEIRQVDDLKGCSVGVKIGSTGAKLANDLQEGGMDLTIKEYKDTIESLLDLEVGRVDVVFNDYLNTLVYLKDASSDLQIVQIADGEVHFLSQVGLGIAVPVGEAELLAEINASLAAMKQDGTLEQLHQKWLMSEREQE